MRTNPGKGLLESNSTSPMLSIETLMEETKVPPPGDINSIIKFDQN